MRGEGSHRALPRSRIPRRQWSRSVVARSRIARRKRGPAPGDGARSDHARIGSALPRLAQVPVEHHRDDSHEHAPARRYVETLIGKLNEPILGERCERRELGCEALGETDAMPALDRAEVEMELAHHLL